MPSFSEIIVEPMLRVGAGVMVGIDVMFGVNITVGVNEIVGVRVGTEGVMGTVAVVCSGGDAAGVRLSKALMPQKNSAKKKIPPSTSTSTSTRQP